MGLSSFTATSANGSVSIGGTSRQMGLMDWDGTGLLEPLVSASKWPGQAGETVRSTALPVRDLMLPIAVYGGRVSGTEGLRTQLENVFSPSAGYHTIDWARPDGVVRRLKKCLLIRGLSWNTSKRIGGLQTAVLEIRAYDPYWYSSDGTQKFDSLYGTVVVP